MTDNDMGESASWTEDEVWTEALDAFQQLRRNSEATLEFDLQQLEQAFYDRPIFQHVDYVIEAERSMGMDGRRYVPRLMMALFIILHEQAGTAKSKL